MRKLAIPLLILAALVAAGLGYARVYRKTPPPPPAPIAIETQKMETIGQSTEGRPIEAYTFSAHSGIAKKKLLFIGGIHGGYEWNSSLLAYQFIDYFKEHPEQTPADISITIIPDANPDGTFEVIGKTGAFTRADAPGKTDESGKGRFNANGVDLNRNFDCKWKPESTWRSKKVSAGTNAFSERESRAIRDYVLRLKPDGVVTWHSQADTVYASECENGILPQTLAMMEVYADAAGYNAVKSFDAYPVAGDAEGWLAKVGIPAITVEMSTHDEVEWEQNLAGMTALFALYSKP